MSIKNNFAAGITAVVESLTDASKLEFANVLFKAAFNVGDLRESHTVLTDIRDGERIPIMDSGDAYSSLAESQGDCSMNECDLELTFSTKKWELGEYDCRIPICLKTFSKDFLLFFEMYRQSAENPLEQPDKKAFLEYIMGIARERVLGASWRTLYHGDKAAASNKLISANNGFFVQAEAGDGLKINLAKAEPTAQELYDAMEEAYLTAQDEPWFDESKLKWRLTSKAARKLVTMLNKANDLNAYNCECIDPEKITQARKFNINNLMMFGIPVIAHKEIDLSGTAAGVKGLTMALLIRDENFLVGVNTEESMNEFRFFYDNKDRKIYIDMMIYLGASIVLDEYVFISNKIT